MYSIEQVQRGFLRYIDTEIVSKSVGLQKWAVGAACALYANNLNNIVEEMRNAPVINALGIFPEGGGIDIDALYRALKPQADKCAVTFDAPIIGSLTLNAADVDRLYECIRSS